MNGKSMGRPQWTGIAPSPKVFEHLDQEQTAVLALLTWSAASNRPVTAADIAALPDRKGSPLGIVEAKHIVRTLAELKVISVLGMNNNEPLGLFIGGFQPRSAVRRPAPIGRSAPGRPTFSQPVPGQSGPARPGPGRAVPAPAPKPDYHLAKPNAIIEHKTGNLPALRTTELTPAFVQAEAGKLRVAQAKVEGGRFGDDLVAAATERKQILVDRIALYERWLGIEKSHPELPKYLARKRKALPELEYQLERARVKQAELNAG